MAEAKASTRAKRRYNNKVYAMVAAELPKDLVARFKEKCKETGIPQASVLREAIERFLEK